MRRQLQPLVDQKVTAVGRIGRYGLKSEYIGGDTVTVLLQNILLHHSDVTAELDHAWLKCGKTFARLNIPTGSLIGFHCHVKKYWKGHVRHSQYIDDSRADIGLNQASKIQIVEKGRGETFQQFLKRMKKERFITNKYDQIFEKACIAYAVDQSAHMILPIQSSRFSDDSIIYYHC
jgi:hypothetical protein